MFGLIFTAYLLDFSSLFIRSRESFKDLTPDQITSPTRIRQSIQLVSNCGVGVRIRLITIRMSLFTHGKMSEKYVGKVTNLFT
jgi:hypothetical protein